MRSFLHLLSLFGYGQNNDLIFARHKHQVIIGSSPDFPGDTKNCIQAKLIKISATLFNKMFALYQCECNSIFILIKK